MNMGIPFTFGKIVSGKDFANRHVELESLKQYFLAGTNVIMISPRRWGKSSLILNALEKTVRADKQVRYCYIDLFNVKTESEFYELLAKEILKSVSNNLEDVISLAGKFLSNLIPQITFSPDNINSFSLGLNWKEVKKHPDELLGLAQKMAESKKIKLIVCIDEFQNISEFKDSLKFQKKLRANWQRHSKVTYCLFGSKRHMMQEVFASVSMPFYKFGELMLLEKISLQEWVKFIQRRFNETEKSINAQVASLIAELVECHPYYVQQLAQQSWFRSKKNCTAEIVNEAYQNLIRQLSLLYQTLTDGLTSTQINFLKAVINGEQHFSASGTLKQYSLGTSANITRIKNTLLQKEIIDVHGKDVELLDPVYKDWLKQYYFIQ